MPSKSLAASCLHGMDCIFIGLPAQKDTPPPRENKQRHSSRCSLLYADCVNITTTRPSLVGFYDYCLCSDIAYTTLIMTLSFMATFSNSCCGDKMYKDKEQKANWRLFFFVFFFNYLITSHKMVKRQHVGQKWPTPFELSVSCSSHLHLSIWPSIDPFIRERVAWTLHVTTSQSYEAAFGSGWFLIRCIRTDDFLCFAFSADDSIHVFTMLYNMGGRKWILIPRGRGILSGECEACGRALFSFTPGLSALVLSKRWLMLSAAPFLNESKHRSNWDESHKYLNMAAVSATPNTWHHAYYFSFGR